MTINKYIRGIIALLLSWAVAGEPIVSAQSLNVSRRITLALYDLDSTTDIGCSYGPPIPITTDLITTSGSSATTTSVNTRAPFARASVGDLITVNVATPNVNTTASTLFNRVITAKASSNSITVDSVWTLPTAGTTFFLSILTCGANAGWIPVTASQRTAEIAIQIAQQNTTTGISMKIEGMDCDDTNICVARNLWPGLNAGAAQCGAGTYSSGYCVYTTAVNPPVFSTDGMIHPTFMRVVMKLTSTDDGGDTGVNAEKINIIYTESK